MCFLCSKSDDAIMDGGASVGIVRGTATAQRAAIACIDSSRRRRSLGHRAAI